MQKSNLKPADKRQVNTFAHSLVEVNTDREAVIEAYLNQMLGVKSPKSSRHINLEPQVRRRNFHRVKRELPLDVKAGEARMAGIDKLDIQLYEPVDRAWLEQRAKVLGLPFEFERLGKQRGTYAFRIGHRDGEHVHAVLSYLNAKSIYKIASNPNRFVDFRRYSQFLINIFGLNQFDSMKIKRADFNVDLEMSYQTLSKIMRVKLKRLYNRHVNKDSEETGMDYGSGDRRLVFYNKTEQLNSKGIEIKKSIARIELRYTGKEVPVEYVKDLPRITQHKIFDKLKFFTFISLEPFTLLDIDKVSDRKQLIKLVRLKSYLEAGGLDLAYRKLNTNGNFYRDHRDLFTFHKSPYDLNKILHDHLSDFFGKPRRVTL